MGWDIAQREDGTVELTDTASTKPRPPIILGRGETDSDITFLALRNEGGTLVYIYPDAVGTAVTVSTTKP